MVRQAVSGFVAACLALTLALTAHVAADAPIVIKFSHVAAPQAHKSRGAEKLKELCERYTNGRVTIELFPNSQLYKDKEELEALQLGAVQMLAPSLSKFGPLGIKAFEVFDLPYLFKDSADIAKVTDGPIGKELLSRLEEKDIVGLGFWNNGFKILSANRPLIEPDDVLGLKMRIQPSRVIEAQMTALGALPQVMAFSETYQALSSGVVDGTENPPANMYTQKMFEVQKYATLTYHGFLGYAVIFNKPFWDKLPPDIQAAIRKAMAEATPIANDLARQENETSLAEILKTRKTEFHTPTDTEQTAWAKALRPVHDEMAARVGPELIERIRAALGYRPAGVAAP